MQSEVGVPQITGGAVGGQVQSEVGCIRGRPSTTELAQRNTSHEHNVRRIWKPNLDATERPRMNALPRCMFELCALR